VEEKGFWQGRNSNGIKWCNQRSPPFVSMFKGSTNPHLFHANPSWLRSLFYQLVMSAS
jgi:hypothetical protein